MNQTYDAQANGEGSYWDAVKALREQHRTIVKALLPALRRARYHHHISCHTLAAQIGVSESALNAWEAERHIPNPALLSRWRDLLKV